LSAFAGRPLDRATLTEATDVIMDAITVLLATLRGEQPPAERWDPAAHKQAKHGRFMERGAAAPAAPAASPAAESKAEPKDETEPGQDGPK
ncbi:MAG: hypothetical protein ACREN5_05500, partial [Gemmatimonadales bacterium]